FVERAAQHQPRFVERENFAGADVPADLSHPQDVALRGPQDFARVQQPPSFELRGPVRTEVLLAEQQEVHPRSSPSLLRAALASLPLLSARPSRSATPCARTSGEGCSEKWNPAW